MAKRALAALLALAAALAFVVAIASSAFWSGHPVVNGRPITAKVVHVGLLGAKGCNTGGDGSCEAVDIGGTFKVASYAELGATALATLLASNSVAQTHFEAFPRSAKRAILEWIAHAKRPETRAQRIAETVRMAAENKRANQWRQ